MVRSIFMNRSILMSIGVIGAAIALVGGGGAFSAFTDTDTDTGTVTAGTVNIAAGAEGVSAFVFAPGAAGCPTNIAPGNSCDATVTITNSGSLPVTLSAPVLTPGGALSTCDGGGHLTAVGTPAYTPGVTVIAPGGGTTTVAITATLAAGAGNDCQGDSGTIELSVTATQA